jgi:hypothetical protein
MPVCSEHIEQAEHNEELAQRLIGDEPVIYKDWAVIVSFYSAVHFIEAFRASRGGHSDYHKERNNYAIFEFPNKIAKAYMKLYHLSRFLRYLEFEGETKPSKGTWVSDADVIICVTVNLLNIKNEIYSRLKSTA